jgi:hypothetical protein
MAKRKARRRTPEEEAEWERLMKRFRARIAEREAIDERLARERADEAQQH